MRRQRKIGIGYGIAAAAAGVGLILGSLTFAQPVITPQTLPQGLGGFWQGAKTALVDPFGNVFGQGNLLGLPTSPQLMAPIAGSQEALGVATPTTLTVPAGANTAYVTVETQAVRWRADGSVPTASAGTLMPVNSVTIFRLTSFTNLQFIQVTATATIDVEYFRE